MSRTNKTKTARRSPAALLKTAATLDRQAADKFRDRPTHTPRMLKHARSAEREGGQLRRAAEFIRAYCHALEQGDLPAALDGFVPSKDRFLEIAARKGRMVSNGYHGYYVDSDEWQDNGPAAEAIRALADNAKSPDQQQAEADQARQLEIKRMIDELRNVDIEGFFPTPDAVIDMMLAAADMHDGQTVLEPSAGIGSICDRVLARFPAAAIDAVEIRPALRKIIEAKGHRVVGSDFNQYSGNGKQYDRVLMNPPFEKSTDMVHVRRAWNFVKPGGRLVAIMSNAFRFRTHDRAAGFRAWLEEMDGDVVELREDAFNGSNAFRRTGVKAVMVAVCKPAPEENAGMAVSTSVEALSTHSDEAAGFKPQVSRAARKTSSTSGAVKADAGQALRHGGTQVSESKTTVPTNPDDSQQSKHHGESNAVKTNPSEPTRSPITDHRSPPSLTGNSARSAAVHAAGCAVDRRAATDTPTAP